MLLDSRVIQRYSTTSIWAYLTNAKEQNGLRLILKWVLRVSHNIAIILITGSRNLAVILIASRYLVKVQGLVL
jgi:hypothetical protein